MSSHTKVSVAGLLIALGIIYGDIGTSPLYVLNAITNGKTITSNLIIGSLSLIIWTLTLQTTIKYVILTLQADNRGEGGIFSLFALVRRRKRWLVIPAMIGGAALLADGMITPPITVTSAIEGLKVIPAIGALNQSIVIYIVIGILTVLFFIQQFGTALIGRFFGPVMSVWFVMLAVLGIAHFADDLSVLIHVDTTEDTILLIMYFVIALVNGVLTYKIRQVEKAARLKEERANSVQLYNTILNSLSHELRTPISAIIVATDNLQQNQNLSGEEKEQLIAEISTASLRLNQQVENLLNLSRLESGHIKPKADWCDVQELIYEVVKRVEELNPLRKIGISISQDIPFCWLDKVMLEQVVYNLLNNAAIHTKAEAGIDIAVMCHADLLQIEIEDAGEGFQDVNVKDVFHKFSRERKQEGNGHGLGLSIVKGFTEALGGTVDVQNKKSGGALFRVYLPVKTVI